MSGTARSTPADAASGAGLREGTARSTPADAASGAGLREGTAGSTPADAASGAGLREGTAGSTPAGPASSAVLRETEAVHWRPRVDARRLTITGRLWTATSLAHSVPFTATAAGLFAVDPITAPVGLALLAHAWAIPELYARRGANVVRPARRAGAEAERTALGLLGDLVGHEARALYARTGLVLERGGFGSWLVGEAGAVLVCRGGRRVHCWCVRVDDPGLPGADRTAHLLLALREDEAGFATVANQAFSGAPWRLRRRMPAPMRPALDAAVAAARA